MVEECNQCGSLYNTRDIGKNPLCIFQNTFGSCSCAHLLQNKTDCMCDIHVLEPVSVAYEHMTHEG